MKRYIAAVLSLSIIFFASASASAPYELTIVSDVWPPFVMDDNEYPGVDVEVMLAVFSRMNVNVRFELYPWQRAVTMATSGEADGVLDIFITPDRLSRLIFPETPISKTSTALFCMQCDPRKTVTEEEMRTRSLIVNRGYKYSILGNDPEIAKTAVDNFEQGFTMLRMGRADYYLVNRQVGLYALKQMGIDDIFALDQRIEDPSEVYLAFARRPELVDIASRFGRELKVFLQSDEYGSILMKYGLKQPALWSEDQ